MEGLNHHPLRHHVKTGAKCWNDVLLASLRQKIMGWEEEKEEEERD